MKKLWLISLVAGANILSAQSTRIPRMPGGKPNFAGVWAGPAFTHVVGPNDTDTPRVTNFDRSKMAPFQPGAQSKFLQPPTGDPRHDDPTELCLPDGHPREALAPYAKGVVIATKAGLTRQGPNQWLPVGRPVPVRIHAFLPRDPHRQTASG